MCLLVVCDTRKMSAQEIENAWDSNDHGAGIAYVRGKSVRVRKGIMRLEDLQALYDAVEVLPHVVHFRVATSGGVSPKMTHPFVCEVPPRLDTEYETQKPVLFQNGVMSCWDTAFASLLGMLAKKGKRAAQGPWNDTRVAALSVGACGTPDVLQVLGGGKYVVLSPKRPYVQMIGDFTHDEGAYFSNSSYKYKTYKYNWGWGCANDDTVDASAQYSAGHRARRKYSSIFTK